MARTDSLSRRSTSGAIPSGAILAAVALLLAPSALAAQSPARVLNPPFSHVVPYNYATSHQTAGSKAQITHPPAYQPALGKMVIAAEVSSSACTGRCSVQASIYGEMFVQIGIPTIVGTTHLVLNYTGGGKSRWSLTPGSCRYSYQPTYSCSEGFSISLSPTLSLVDQTVRVTYSANNTPQGFGSGAVNSSGCDPTSCWVSNSGQYVGSSVVKFGGPSTFSFRGLAPHHHYVLEVEFLLKLDVWSLAKNTQISSGAVSASLDMAGPKYGFDLLSLTYS